MDPIDLDALDYSRAWDDDDPLRRQRSCRRKIYLQAHVSGAVFSIFTTCRSNRCDDCGPEYRRKQIAWLARCFAPFDQLYLAPVPGNKWANVKRSLQRHRLLYVWVKGAGGSFLVLATGDFTRDGIACVAVSQGTALGLLLAKLRRPDLLAPKRALDACRAWSKERAPREEPQSRKLGTARREVSEAELAEIARELHLRRGGRWPDGAARPPDLTPDDYGNLFAEAIDEDWRRYKQGRAARRT
jgi:hypothetical protein